MTAHRPDERYAQTHKTVVKYSYQQEIAMDEIIKQLGDKWPFKYHYCEDGEVLEKQPVPEEPIEEAPF
jgi:hypothetical protein